MPEACTFVPGAWLATTSRAVADAWNTGRGPAGSHSAQARQRRTSLNNASSDCIGRSLLLSRTGRSVK
jgi:hypothetical protein